MKKQNVVSILGTTLSVITLFSLTLFFSCTKKSESQYGSGRGQVMFWTQLANTGIITIHLNNETKTLSYYHSNVPPCDNQNVVTWTLPAGTYTMSATSVSGGSWSGTVTVEEGVCISREFLTPGGGGGGIVGASGNPRFNLQFNNEQNVDLDLHVLTPNGIELYFSNKSGDGGQLDVDCLCGTCPNGPNENIYWEPGTAPHGQYKYWVQYYNNCGVAGASSAYTLRRLVNNTVVSTNSGTLSSGKSPVYLFNY